MIDKILKDVLDTAENKWNYFFLPHRIKEVLTKLANQIQTENFFTSSYSINKFLDFLKTYVKANLNHRQLDDSIDIGILREFNQVCMTLQERIINHTTGLDESQQGIISNYLNFLRQLMENEHRNLFAKPEIKLNSTNIQSIAGMLRSNSASINADLIHQYISLLRLSFDVPELLVKYEVGLNILPLAKACFLNKNIDVHVAATQFFYVLGYQGQLLDYYKIDPRFNITEQLFKKATNNLKHQAIALQQYFFNNLNQRAEIDKPLLQHYLYVQFFKVIYKKYPDQLDALKTDPHLLPYLKFDYVALPNSWKCLGFPAGYSVRIEYDHLSRDVLKIACAAIRCSKESNDNWKKSLNLHLPKYKSDYTYRVANSYKEYSVTYAYGYPPTGSGFYISKKLINQTVYGEGYSYWENDTHNFIDVTRHEARHHDNSVFTQEAYSVNPEIVSITGKSINEGIAVNSGGACYPGFIDADLSKVAAPTVPSLLEESFIGYFRSWLYTNYLIQEHPDFYRDILTLDRDDFKKRSGAFLIRDEQHFFDWLPYLKQVCKAAPKKFSLEYCPSPFLKDYLPAELKNPLITTTSHLTPRQTMPQTSRTTTTVRSNNETHVSFTRPAFYDEYLSLMHAINAKNTTEIDGILQHSAYRVSDIVNYQNPERGLETPLHFLFAMYRKNCPDLIIEKFCRFGAFPNLINDRNETAYMMAKDCDNWARIKILFDNQIQNLKKSTEKKETALVPYQQQKLAITINIPLSAFVSGVLAGGWEEVAKRNSRQYLYLPNIIFYGLKPVSSAMGNAVMNSLLVGSAASIGLEDAWLSFAYYLGVNYLGLMLAQLGEKATKKIQNKLLNILMPILLYTFFLNPSLLITLLSEGFSVESFQAVMMPLLSMLSSGIFFTAGVWGANKAIEKFFPVATEYAVNNKYFLRYSLDGTPKRISSEQETLQNIQEKLKHLTIKIKKAINNQAYKLNFDKDVESATANIATLLVEISKEEQNINPEEYKTVFKDFEENVSMIRHNLDILSQEESKIKLLKEGVTEILIILRGIRPLPQVNSPDLVTNHGKSLTFEEEQHIPLMTFANGKNNIDRHDNSGTPRYTRTPTSKFKNSFFPTPPTDEELLEMGVINEVHSPGMA